MHAIGGFGAIMMAFIMLLCEQNYSKSNQPIGVIRMGLQIGRILRID